MTMDRGLLDMDQQIATWDTLMEAQAPSYPQEFYSSADAFAETEPYQPTYADPAADVYSYAGAEPSFEYQPESAGPYELVESVAPQEYVASQSYSVPDFSYRPEPAGFFESRNPLFAESNAQFDYTTDPANRTDLDPIGMGLSALGDAASWAVTPVGGPWGDFVETATDAVIRNRSLNNQFSPASLGTGKYYPADPAMVEAAATVALPQTPLDFAFMAGPAAASLRGGGGLYGAAAEALAFGPGTVAREGLQSLPDAARLRSVLDVPQYADEALDLAGVAGRTVVPRTLGPELAEQLPVGIRVAGAAEQVATDVAQQVDEFAGNIRLAKYPEDIRGAVADWAARNADVVEEARRGVRSDEQVLTDAQTLVNDLGGDFAKLQRTWKAGEAWNAEEVTAIRGALTDSTRKVMDAAEAARVADSTENQIRLAEAILEQQRIQQIVTGVTAEAGRSLRAFRTQSAEALANGDVARMQQILKQALGASDNADIAKLTAAIRALDVNDPVAVSIFLRSVNKPGFWDYITEYWYNSILSGPWTHMRNAIGNTAATMTEPVRRLGAAGVEDILARAGGRAPERFWQEAPASVIGAVHGFPEGIRGALETVKTGFNPQSLSRIELRKQAAIPGPVGRVVRIPSTALEAADAFFYSINYRSSLYANATRAARREGLAGSALSDRVAQLVASPTAAIVKRSADDAERLLFRGDPGSFANWLGRGKEQFPALQFVIPFIKTPANLLKFGIRNSPIGLLDVPMWRRVLAKNPQASDELAQTLIGSAVAAGMGAMVATGQLDITAGVPTDAAERDRFYREGKLPFAVKMPGVGWVQYNQIPGLDTTLTALASVVQGVREGENVNDIASQIGATLGQSMLDRSYMSGLSDFMDAIGDPTRFAARYSTRQATSGVPFSSFFRQIATAIDPTIRAPENLADSFAANLPGLTGNVPARLTVFGEDAQRGLPSPIQVSPDSTSPLDTELGRLGVEVTFVGNSIGGHKLSDQEQRDYQKLAGEKTAEILNALIDDPRYGSLDDVGKQKIIEKAVDLARDEARDVLKANNYRIPEGGR